MFKFRVHYGFIDYSIKAIKLTVVQNNRTNSGVRKCNVHLIKLKRNFPISGQKRRTGVLQVFRAGFIINKELVLVNNLAENWEKLAAISITLQLFCYDVVVT